MTSNQHKEQEQKGVEDKTNCSWITDLMLAKTKLKPFFPNFKSFNHYFISLESRDCQVYLILDSEQWFPWSVETSKHKSNPRQIKNSACIR